jgi:hypothetical protein
MRNYSTNAKRTKIQANKYRGKGLTKQRVRVNTSPKARKGLDILSEESEISFISGAAKEICASEF